MTHRHKISPASDELLKQLEQDAYEEGRTAIPLSTDTILSLIARIRAEQAKSVQIRPLEWMSDTEPFWAVGPFCSFRVAPDGLRWQLTTHLRNTADRKYETAEAAKAAAQQDYEARISSALMSTHTDTKGDNVQEAGQPVGTALRHKMSEWADDFEAAAKQISESDWKFAKLLSTILYTRSQEIRDALAHPTPEPSEREITDAMVIRYKTAYSEFAETALRDGTDFADFSFEATRAALRALIEERR